MKPRTPSPAGHTPCSSAHQRCATSAMPFYWIKCHEIPIITSRHGPFCSEFLDHKHECRANHESKILHLHICGKGQCIPGLRDCCPKIRINSRKPTPTSKRTSRQSWLDPPKVPPPWPPPAASWPPRASEASRANLASSRVNIREERSMHT